MKCWNIMNFDLGLHLCDMGGGWQGWDSPSTERGRDCSHGLNWAAAYPCHTHRGRFWEATHHRPPSTLRPRFFCAPNHASNLHNHRPQDSSSIFQRCLLTVLNSGIYPGPRCQYFMGWHQNWFCNFFCWNRQPSIWRHYKAHLFYLHFNFL